MIQSFIYMMKDNYDKVFQRFLMLASLQLLKKVVGSNPIDYSKVLERSGYKYAANILKFSPSYLSQSYCKKIVKEMKIPELSIACSVIRNWA